MELILNSKLLEQDFNPFQSICENPLDQRDQSLEYRAFHDYLISLKIISKRLIAEYADLFKDGNRTALDPSGWSMFYKYELDTDSFVIFTRILLDRVGMLIQKLSNITPNNYIKSFTDLKKKCINIQELVLVTPLLLNLNWYDHSLSFMRDNLIVHGGVLAGSRRMIASEFKYNKTNSKFGFLSVEDQVIVRNMIVSMVSKKKKFHLLNLIHY